MQTLEEMKAKHAAELAKLEAEQAIACLAPVPPRFVILTATADDAWLSYDATNLWSAIDLMAQFQPLTMHKFKGTYTRYQPEILADKERGEIVAGPFVAGLDVSQGEGFGPTVMLFFYAKLGDKICRIRISLRDKYNDRFGQYGARFIANERGSGKRLDEYERYRRGEWQANNTLAAMCNDRTKWGTGDDKSAHFSYLLMADNDDDDGFAAWDMHARPMLESIALAFHGERGE